MNNSEDKLPQDWPEYLAPDAEVAVARTVPPIGEPLLDFTAMSASTFEQFCWWLLKKDQTLIGCKRLGRIGTAQHGIDLFAYDGHQGDAIRVFECKAWTNFQPAKLTEAVDAFLGNDWIGTVRSFTLILAQQDAGEKLLHRWHQERERLKKVGVEGDLWTAHTLTLKVQAYPDILSKFFPWHSVEAYANKWMQRVAFHEVVSKAFFDPREHVARWAREMAAGPKGTDPASSAPPLYSGPITSDQLPCFVDGTYRQVSQFGNSWHFKGPWLSLSAILPDERFTHASVAITFKRPDMEGMTLTVDQGWLLKNFLFRVGAPLTGQYRGFIVGTNPQDADQCLIDLPHCRLFLQQDGAHEIANVADLLTEAMRTSFRALELSWSALHFPFVAWAGKKVALVAIDSGVWREIGRFVEEHDASNGDTRWHMFDGNRQVLKPYHAKETAEFDVGYHGVFYATEIEGLSWGNEVALLWQPRDLAPGQTFSRRGWWSCDFAFEWFNETFLPEVKRWVYNRHFGGGWKKLFRFKEAEMYAAYLDSVFVARDLRRPPLMSDGEWTKCILEAVEELQKFFISAGTPEPYIWPHEIEDLYRAAAILARGKRGYVGYAASKLNLRDNPADHEELIRMIDDHIREGRVVANCSMADYVFRAMLELLDGADDWLSAKDQETIKSSIAPFAALRDDAVLIERHGRWA
jgi:hypothetical protein